ncbi:MAG: hypothetical protein A3F13_01935 [Gammaproteobacteria bacterium RIFCSPHIGHO2_12_FULL_40_19]|nr:MAG: hypothetical protein A3F13_01935 [Gammaproteobacteria bacterium RIFCSPHIGHO2_12_FULL_40_19]
MSSLRATVPAEAYFTQEALVDIQINADYFRHLPGIMTGIGIIGTFSGLVWGLHSFSAIAAAESLGPLLKEVTSAFIGSGVAIFAAICITFWEKITLNRCYKLVEELHNTIDSLFATGAGEEYLARLVLASEKNSTHTAALKDALIEDLKTLMNDVADKHISAQANQSAALAGQISDAIKNSLEEPFKELGGIVRTASGNQGEQVSGLLENLLTAFMAKIDDTFGQQLAGINAAIQKSSDSMTLVQEAMSRLIGDIANAGQSAASEMSSKLEESMSKAALAQEKMNEQMREFVNELRDLIISQQNESKSALDEAMKLVLTQLQEAISSIASERSNQIAQDRERTNTLSVETKALYGGLSENINKLIEDIKVVTFKTEENINLLQKSSSSAISGMNDGALVMKEAAEKFTVAGKSVTGVLENSKLLGDQITQTATALQSTSNTVRQAFDQYDRTRKETQEYVVSLQALIENAKKESGIGSRMISDLERILASLETAEKQSVDYLDNVNNVLKGTFETFGSEMVEQVKNVSVANDKILTNSLGALQGAVESMIAAVARIRRPE